ncbi:hypothetical protein PN498_06405 [Oscillatoria sp. CS-180]|uniref:hypothetical protein n=1 Tax=Oscillatoria sp. CS-180 TaxID=3021720 RepID=UPI00232C5E51|nr:hypothetical protein [Oscillatoria sp. CS-180]MDB9525612.1 hypothetical protein [Oscillatoria sp. CS-180]
MNNSPFHNPNSAPLPDANDVEKEFRDQRHPESKTYEPVELSEQNRLRFEADKRWLRKFIVGLLVMGLAVGGILSIGLVWTMNRLNLIEPTRIEGDR